MTNNTPKKRKMTVTLPDGTVATRTTARDYSHVLVAFGPTYGNPTPHWVDFSWHGTEAAAAKNITQAAKGFTDCRIVPVD